MDALHKLIFFLLVSETDDDLQYSGIIKVSNGLAHPRVMPNTSGPVSCGKGRRDMDFQIHCLEMEAYTSVLKAFVAQSDVLSWVRLTANLFHASVTRKYVDALTGCGNAIFFASSELLLVYIFRQLLLS